MKLQADLGWNGRRGAHTDFGPPSSFYDLMQVHYQVERTDRETGELAMVSIDEALSGLAGYCLEPLDLLIQGVTLKTPAAFYRLNVKASYLN